MKEGDHKDAQNVYDSHVVAMHEQFVTKMLSRPLHLCTRWHALSKNKLGTESARKWCKNNSELVNDKEMVKFQS